MSLLAAHRLRERDDALLVGMAEHDHAAVVEHVGDLADLAARVEATGLDGVERLVQDEQLALHQLLGAQVRMHVHAHHLAVDVDLDGAVLVGTLEHAVGVRRRAQLVDLFLEQVDLLLRVLQRVDELLVLALRVVVLLARAVVALPQEFVLHQQPLHAAHEITRIGPEEAKGLPQTLDLVLLVATAAATAGLIARTRRCNPLHDVSNEASPA